MSQESDVVTSRMAIPPATETRAAEIASSTGAELLLLTLRRCGVDYLLANAGTDFPPIIEAYLKLEEAAVPAPVIVPHETVAVGMAHGYYLMTGRTLAVMLHTNVGLANGAMGVINAASDNVPLLLMSGRTPITERGRDGCRDTPIHYGQEMYDQMSLVRDVTKFQYELHYAEQAGHVVARAITLARDEPRGPVYVALPREPLMAPPPPDGALGAVPASSTPPSPDASAVETAARWLAAARSPLMICQRGDVEGRTAAAVAALAHEFAVPVVQPFLLRNVLASDDEMMLGYDVGPALSEADVVLVVDSPVPWIESRHHPAAGKKIVHIGPDPNFRRVPVRSYQTDLAISSDPAAALEAIRNSLPQPGFAVSQRRERVSVRAVALRKSASEQAGRGNTSPMSVEWMSRCLSEIMDDDAVLFSELGVSFEAMRIRGPNRVFNNPHSGGLGWALPAALGAQLANRDRLCIACIGDGSYIFANPVACHQVARTLQLPVLVIVKNNGMWNAVRRATMRSYPGGLAVRSGRFPLSSLQPSADYARIAAASGAYTEKVADGAALRPALERALTVIRSDHRQVLLELNVEVSSKQ